MTSASQHPGIQVLADGSHQETGSEVRIRRASLRDADHLRAMHRGSLTELGRGHYSRGQIEGFLHDFDTVDEAILAVGTLLVAEAAGAIVASAAWTLRRPAYAVSHPPSGEAGAVSATLRAVFTHPAWGRRGLASRLMDLVEEEAVIHGRATHLELGATLPAVEFYRGRGYQRGQAFELALSNRERFAAINMHKHIIDPAAVAAA